MASSTNQTEVRLHDRVWRFAPLLLWIGVIFFMSSSQGSLSQTSRIIRPILEFLFPAESPETITLYHGIIRKFAHFAEYAVLGLLASRAFTESVFRWRPYVLAVLLVCVVAAIDETNQSFNPNRTGSAVDVLIDVLGGLTAVGFYYWLSVRRRS